MTAYEVATWTWHVYGSGREAVPAVTRSVMAEIVARQAQLHDIARSVVQRDSFPTPAGEAFPALDHLSWEGERVRVDSQFVIEPADVGGETRTAFGSFHLQPGPNGLYHLYQLGWDLCPVRHDDSILRPVAASVGRDVDAVGLRVVDAVDRGELTYDQAARTKLVTVALMARGQAPTSRTTTPRTSATRLVGPAV
ncbi:hypothetical protein [Phytoactinopolyspora limicola]|uniref:hypothetical protein n=1 Tax=Phytoactinopolyspora limicola TaxID=2715536 RepID=UPI00140A4B66|nr:hypothetical protein [Phytoactinopolyspora limicola]